jgi:DNA-binding CsgD family transcriptional regulator
MSSITLSSARTYLKSIFAKTGVVRQAELVQLVLTSSAAYVND